MKDKRIEVVKNWPEPKSMRDIQIFLGCAGFYQCFIWGLSKLVRPLTLMLRTSSITRLSNNLSASIDKAENAEVGEGNSGDKEIVERSPSKKPNVPTGYLNFLCSKQRWVSLDSFGYDWGFQFKALSEKLQNKALVKSAGPISFFDITLLQLSNFNL